MALIECVECGKMISNNADACPHCGVPIEHKITCEECGTEIRETEKCCSSCGCPNPLFGQKVNNHYTKSNQTYNNVNSTVSNAGTSGKSRIAFALFAIFLGGFGIHFFYVGKVGAGVLNLVLCTIGCILFFIPPFIIWILNLVVGIVAATMSQEEFERRYVYSDSFYPI